MKFNNGCWLLKEGTSAFAPKEIYDTSVTSTCVRLLLPTYHVLSRGDTLGNINLTMEITSPAEEVLHIRTFHYRNAITDSPCFELKEASMPLSVSEDSDTLSVSSGTLTACFTKNPFSLVFKRGDEIITTCTGNDLALMKTAWKGLAYDKGDSQDTYIRQMLSLSVGELVYGTGERFTPFVKNGQSIDIWNEDGGTSTEQSYKNIPFYLTNKGYGIFVNHTEKVSFEMGTEMVTRTQFSVPGSYLDYYIINGPSMKEVLTRYTDLTGKPSLPAPWTFGLWLSTSFTTNYDEATCMEFIDGMLSRSIPLRTFHFDCFWMKEFHWCDFLWDSRVFSDPAGMLSRIKAKGLNICVWINPYIGQESSLFEEGEKNGYFIQNENGKPWQWDMWQSGMAIVDFTNPNAWAWYQSKLEVLLDMGVDCFKTDFGERIPFEGVCYHDGSDPKKMHNYYTYLYNKCVYELLQKKRGKKEAVLFARSATVGGQKFPVHWGGDCWSDYESMEESLRGGLSLLMSGFGYWAHDIGGFENTSTADVYKRWVQFGLLSSHSRLHGSSSYRIPWAYDEEAVDVVRKFTRLKARLMPYLYRIANEASVYGIPMMRSMVLEFPEDMSCQYLDKQYMLGDSLLVAPIFNDQGIGKFYLPAGIWTDFFTGERFEGEKWYTRKYDYMHLPLLVKENSILPIGSCEEKPDYDYEKGFELRIYEVLDAASVETVIYRMDGEIGAKIHMERTGNQITLITECEHPFCVRLVNMNPSFVSGASMHNEKTDMLLKDCTQKITITL